MADEPLFNTFAAKRYKPQERTKVSIDYPELDDPVYNMPREEIMEALRPLIIEQIVASVDPAEKFRIRGAAIPHVDQLLAEMDLRDMVSRYTKTRPMGSDIGLKKDVYMILSAEELKSIHSKCGCTQMNDNDAALSAEEERLLSAANRLKTKADMGEISKFVNSDCRVEDPKDRENIINRVMRRVGNTESGHSSGAMGKGHDPNKQLKRISDVIKSMRAF